MIKCRNIYKIVDILNYRKSLLKSSLIILQSMIKFY